MRFFFLLNYYSQPLQQICIWPNAQRKTNSSLPVALEMINIVIHDPDYGKLLRQLIKTCKPGVMRCQFSWLHDGGVIWCAWQMICINLESDEDAGFWVHAKAVRFNCVMNTGLHNLTLFLHPMCQKLAIFQAVKRWSFDEVCKLALGWGKGRSVGRGYEAVLSPQWPFHWWASWCYEVVGESGWPASHQSPCDHNFSYCSTTIITYMNKLELPGSLSTIDLPICTLVMSLVLILILQPISKPTMEATSCYSAKWCWFTRHQGILDKELEAAFAELEQHDMMDVTVLDSEIAGDGWHWSWKGLWFGQVCTGGEGCGSISLWGIPVGTFSPSCCQKVFLQHKLL